MKTKLTPNFLSLTYEALLRSFWRKEALKRFLRRCDVPTDLVSSFGEQETKRAYLDRLFDELNKHSLREELFAKLAMALIDQKSFPDLLGWEDEVEKLAEAKRAVENLVSYVQEQDSELEKAETQKKFYEAQSIALRAQQDLEKLGSRLNQLVSELGTQQGGYKFQDWFYDLMGYFDITAKKPYVVDGRQIDGTITLKDTTYLIELKFTSTQTGAEDIDTFLRKVQTKSDNTMGIFVAMSGFSSVAIAEASRGSSPILLLDYSHVYHVLGGQMAFPDLVDRIKRNASQTGRAYLPVAEV